MTKVIAIANHKGGVGKTTTSLKLAHALAADRTTTVLLCDLDPQASLTKLLGFDIQKLRQPSTTFCCKPGPDSPIARGSSPPRWWASIFSRRTARSQTSRLEIRG